MGRGGGRQRRKMALKAMGAMRQKRINALKGPFRCPGCGGEGTLSCNTKPKSRKVKFTPPNSKERTVTERWIEYRFFCHKCRLHDVVEKMKGEVQIIDVYNEVYDKHLPPVVAESQRSVLRDEPYNLVRLLSCEVKMK